MHTRHLGAAAAALLVAAGPFSQANAQSKVATSDSIQADGKFIRHVIGANQFEVQLGELAQRQATNAMVKKFGERMALDHRRLVKQWTDLAADHGLTITPGLGSKQQKRLARLQHTERKAFDREYMITMIKAHTKDVAHLKEQTDRAHSQPVRKMAAYELPIVQDHLVAAQAAGKEVGVDSAVVARSGHPADDD